jgi:hypothetical protein
MIRVPDYFFEKYLEEKLLEILAKPFIPIDELLRGQLPDTGGVYLFTRIDKEHEETPLYIGVTGNLKQRIYTNHLMGNLQASSFKKYLVESKVSETPEDAKNFIKEHCGVRISEEPDIRKRGALEFYMTARLMPMFGFNSEH